MAGTNSETLADLVDLFLDEVNVKAIELTDDLESHARFVLRPDGRALGPRLGGDVQAVFAGARSGDYTRNDDGTVTVADHVLAADEFELGVEIARGRNGRRTGQRRRRRGVGHHRHRRAGHKRVWHVTWSATYSRPAATPTSW
ncbi:MAG: hypothetical protein Ct9H300mP12_03130 [Acidimicrobiales bacterium]|nr:MAG: hypothetical protein Ct9H300mP12_03130 [Acidimicrobiales bacterium]